MLQSPWSSFPFVRITLAFSAGLWVARYWEGSCWLISSLLSVLLLTYVVVYVSTLPATFRIYTPYLGFLGISSIFLLGYLREKTCEVCRDPRHLIKHAASVTAYEAMAMEDAHEKLMRNRVVVTVCRARIQGVWRHVPGKVQLVLPKCAALQVRYGDILLIRGSPQMIPTARNPHTFDYAAWLGLAQIYHQQFVTEDAIAVLAHRPPNPISAFSFKVLRYCKYLFAKYIHHPEARAIILALVLGQKESLTPEVSTSYIRSGTIHVLAVSGLHVGIIYWVLTLLFMPLRSIGNLRRFLSIISLCVLWLYAFVTGLSPSVLRATAMFTFVPTAALLGKQRNSYHTLAASAFLLLCWNPMLLFTVSFQLSYVAVIGILYLQPRIYRLLIFPYWLLDKLWLLTSVSLGAQLATIPLSIYYFHQFPVYFVVANWVVVPASLLICSLGLMVLMTGSWPHFSRLIAWVLENVVLGVNALIDRISKLPFSLIGSIYLNIFVVGLLYGIGILFLIFSYTKRTKYLMAMNAGVAVLLLHTMQQCFLHQQQCKLIFYSINGHQAIAFIKSHHSTLLVDDRFQADSSKYTYYIQPSQLVLGITSTDTYMLEEAVQQQAFPMQCWHGMKVAVWKGKKIIFIDQSIDNVPKLTEKVYMDVVIVEKNAVHTLKPLLNRFDMDMLVIGASNHRSLSQKLQYEASQHGLCSHALLQQGALMVSW